MSVELVAIEGVPAVQPGDDLAQLLFDAAQKQGLELANGALVVCQKVVSKAEGRVVALADIEPSEQAREIAAEHDKDPRQIELVLRESVRIVRRGHGVLVCETRHGFVCANAGVDLSNATGPEHAVLLPEDPDASARGLHDALVALASGKIEIPPLSRDNNGNGVLSVAQRPDRTGQPLETSRYAHGPVV